MVYLVHSSPLPVVFFDLHFRKHSIRDRPRPRFQACLPFSEQASIISKITMFRSICVELAKGFLHVRYSRLVRQLVEEKGESTVGGNAVKVIL